VFSHTPITPISVTHTHTQQADDAPHSRAPLALMLTSAHARCVPAAAYVHTWVALSQLRHRDARRLAILHTNASVTPQSAAMSAATASTSIITLADLWGSTASAPGRLARMLAALSAASSPL
jgi:hypothetical protein